MKIQIKRKNKKINEGETLNIILLFSFMKKL